MGAPEVWLRSGYPLLMRAVCDTNLNSCTSPTAAGSAHGRLGLNPEPHQTLETGAEDAQVVKMSTDTQGPKGKEPRTYESAGDTVASSLSDGVNESQVLF